MKIIFYSVLLIASLPFYLAAQNGSPKGSLVVEKDIHDFGTIRGEKTVTHDFVVKNKGKKTVVVVSIVEGCGCVSAEMKNKKILPGTSVKVTVKYEADGSPHDFSKTIDIITDEKGEPIYSITVKGKVVD